MGVAPIERSHDLGCPPAHIRLGNPAGQRAGFKNVLEGASLGVVHHDVQVCRRLEGTEEVWGPGCRGLEGVQEDVAFDHGRAVLYIRLLTRKIGKERMYIRLDCEWQRPSRWICGRRCGHRACMTPSGSCLQSQTQHFVFETIWKHTTPNWPRSSVPMTLRSLSENLRRSTSLVRAAQ
jgi:hypothetical protein